MNIFKVVFESPISCFAGFVSATTQRRFSDQKYKSVGPPQAEILKNFIRISMDSFTKHDRFQREISPPSSSLPPPFPSSPPLFPSSPPQPC